MSAGGASALPQAAQNLAASEFGSPHRAQTGMAGVYGGCGRLPPVGARQQRVLAYVTRPRAGRLELLVFDQRGDPEAGTQVPAGRLDPGETLEQGLRRELHEEAGLDRVRIVRELPVLGDWVARSPYENHAFEVRVDGGEAADSWEHAVHGDGDDAGLVFEYRWVPVEPGLDLWRGDDLTYLQLV
jgi:8-oxo-dGTP pyrophosphatase MutT (NUDIX family)